MEPLSEHDRFVFLRRAFGRLWILYAALRRAFARRRPVSAARVPRSLTAAVATATSLLTAWAIVTPEPTRAPDDSDITVVLPTLGRLELLRPVLDQLGKQTVRARQVVVVDQDEPACRDDAVCDEFNDLGLEIVFQDERGLWLAHNEVVRHASGEWIAFVDDDSDVDEDFLEQHLGGLRRYGADLSTGASLALMGAPVLANCVFFRVADQWDSGSGMRHRSLFERFGPNLGAAL